MFLSYDLIGNAQQAPPFPTPKLSQTQKAYAKTTKLYLKMLFLEKVIDHFNPGNVPHQFVEHRRFLENLNHHYVGLTKFKQRCDDFAKFKYHCDQCLDIYHAALNEIEKYRDFHIKNDLVKDPKLWSHLLSINQYRKATSKSLAERDGFKLLQEQSKFFSLNHQFPREFLTFYRKLLRKIPIPMPIPKASSILHPIADEISFKLLPQKQPKSTLSQASNGLLLFKAEGTIQKIASTSTRLMALSALSSTQSCLTENSFAPNNSITFGLDHCLDFHLSKKFMDTIEKTDRAEAAVIKLYDLSSEPCKEIPKLVCSLDNPPHELSNPVLIRKCGDFAAVVTASKGVATISLTANTAYKVFRIFDSPSSIDMDDRHFVIGNDQVGRNVTSKIDLVDYRTGSFSTKQRAHSSTIKTVKLTGDRIYSGSAGGVVKIWDRETFEILTQTNFPGPIKDIIPDENGNYFSITQQGNAVYYLDTRSNYRQSFPFENVTALHYAHQNLYIGTSQGQCIKINPHHLSMKD
ncbi:MAG: hypothetical protein CK425_08665 [Parachlamydia sp.]|nr:MAG: hypothetical protein CK425_08665 [Parachlamydia sp.]